MTSRPLADNGAIVTGASAGIGRETARALATNGANVAIVARRRDRLEEIAHEIESETDSEVLVCPADVSVEVEIEEAVETAASTFGRLDILVNNAGIATDFETPVESFPTEQYRTVMGVNVDGMFFASRAALPHLKKTRGTAIFVGSFAGKNPRPGGPLYAATKWWARGFALSLAGQVGSDDVAVSVVNPSEVRTEFGKEFRSKISKERFERDEVTDPKTVADAIAFVARQKPPNTVSELDLYRRDKFSDW